MFKATNQVVTNEYGETVVFVTKLPEYAKDRSIKAELIAELLNQYFSPQEEPKYDQTKSQVDPNHDFVKDYAPVPKSGWEFEHYDHRTERTKPYVDGVVPNQNDFTETMTKNHKVLREIEKL